MSQIAGPGAVGAGKGLVSTAGATQAGLIQAALKQMDPIKAHCLIARYSPKATTCECCGGNKPIKEWQEAIKVLSEWAMQHLAGSISHKVVREAIILNFYNKGVSIGDAAREAHVPEKTAYNHRARIHAALKEIDAQAQCEIADFLESRGVVTNAAEIS